VGSISELEYEHLLAACGNCVGVYTASFYERIRVGVYLRIL